MRMSGLEDWALAFTLVFAIAFTATIQQTHRGIAANASPLAAADQVPQYAMTITAKRLPAVCKGDVATENAIYCTPFLEAAVVIEVHETAAAYVERTGAVDASVAYNR
jgi:hypothetical protein